MKILRFLFSRMVVVGLMIAIQLGIFLFLLIKFSHYSAIASIICTIISALAVLWIINKNDNPAYKLAWIIPILIFNITGGLLYLLIGNKKPSKDMRLRLEKVQEITSKYLKQNQKVLEEVEKENKTVFGHVNYINCASGFPMYKNTEVKYYSVGEDNYEDLIKELKKAKRYIFMEYFIIEEGKMWNGILEILEQKAKEGLDVRLMYDDMGCISLLPYGYDKVLEKKGIKCIAFNPFKPLLSLVMNNRDHRKITVIDGHTGFTGGINLADEYINEIVRFGHWKDSSIMIRGEAVWNLTMMFLESWQFNCGQKEDYEKYKPYVNYDKEFKGDGYVQPYGDSPLDDETVGENVYLNIINKAKEYVYINTPYLIVDNELVTALTLAAKSGVEVIIVTPHIEDKWYVHMVTRAYYAQLIEAGVKIYEYTPGFIHSKTFVSDDEIGVVGTINMDYRSLYLHFECGVLLYKTKSLMEIKNDFKLITIEDCHRIKWSNKFITAILRVFAPLM